MFSLGRNLISPAIVHIFNEIIPARILGFYTIPQWVHINSIPFCCNTNVVSPNNDETTVSSPLRIPKLKFYPFICAKPSKSTKFCQFHFE